MTRVRLAETSDAPALAALLDTFNREFEAPTPGATVLAGRLPLLLGRTDVFALLADDTAGCALVTLRPNVWYEGPVALLDELFVIPTRRNLGIGSTLLAEVEAEVRRRGGEVVEIDVDGGDTDARRFYQRHGYTDREAGDVQPSLRYFRELA